MRPLFAPGSQDGGCCRRGSEDRSWPSRARGDRAHKTPTRGVLLGAEHVLYTGAHFAVRAVRVRLDLRQRTIASPAFVDTAFEAPRLQLPLRIGRAVGAVGIHVAGRVRLIQKIVELLT